MAFLSDRKAANGEPKVPNHREKEDIENAVAQVYVVSAQGGEAFAVSFSDEDVHSFAWSADSQRILFCHSQSIDGAAKGRTQEGVERRRSVPRIRARRHGLWHRSSLSQRHTRWPTQVDWRDPSRLRSLAKGKPYHWKAITNQSTGPLG